MRVKLIDITGKAIPGEWGTDDTDGTGIPVLRTTNFTNNGTVNYTDVATRQIKKKNIQDKFLRYSDIIIEKSGGSDKQPVGRVIFFEGESNKFLFNNFTGLLRVKDTERWLPKYVFYALFANYSAGGTRPYENRTTGLHNLQTEAYVAKAEITDIPYCEQQRIVAILDKICTLIDKSKQQLAKLDELVKARFVEMFGDPLLNEKNFETKTGAECFKLTNGKFVPENKRYSEGIPAYGGNGISWYTDDILCANDTIVVGRVGFQSGNVHLVRGPLWVTDNAMYISSFLEPKYDLVFLTALMEHIDFTKYQDAGDLKKITQKPFMTMKFLYPPLELQKQYTTFVQSIDQTKSTIQASLDELETLKQSLMQEYFE